MLTGWVECPVHNPSWGAGAEPRVVAGEEDRG